MRDKRYRHEQERYERSVRAPRVNYRSQQDTMSVALSVQESNQHKKRRVKNKDFVEDQNYTFVSPINITNDRDLVKSFYRSR